MLPACKPGKTKTLACPATSLSIGEMPGYFGDRRDSRKWLITDADIGQL